MTQYSEVVGSFLRNGSFPLEADYVFETELALVEFYSDENNLELLHQGWLKIVGEGDELALYWVVKEEDELKFVKLIERIDRDTIYELLSDLDEKLNKETKAREDADNEIWGNKDEVISDINNIELLSKAVNKLRTEMSKAINSISYIIKGDDSLTLDTFVSYLQTLDYPSIEALSKALKKFLEVAGDIDDNINTLTEIQHFLEGYEQTDQLKKILERLVADLMGSPLPTEEFRTLRGIEDFVRLLKSLSENTDANLQSELDRTLIGVGLSGDGSYNADQETYYLRNATSIMNALKTLDKLIHDNTIKVSNEAGNLIVVKNDGIYHNIEWEYEDGIITIKVNGTIVKNIPLGLSTVVEDAFYDSDLESITIIFKLLNGESQRVRIPVTTLIREWGIDNSQPSKVVELTREESIGPGTDKLSADVRLSTNPNNILQKDGNTLLVDGSPITELKEELDYEVTLRTIAELDLQSKMSNLQNNVDTALKNAELDVVSTDSVQLSKTRNEENRNQLSADVRVVVNKNNILEKTEEGLLVRGTSDNITHNGLNLDEVIKELQGDDKKKTALVFDSYEEAYYAKLSLGLTFYLTQDSSSLDTGNTEKLYRKGYYVVTEDDFILLSLDEELEVELLEGLSKKIHDIELNIQDSYTPETADTYILKRESGDGTLLLTFTPISPSTLTVPENIGDITKGTTAESLKGKSLSEILDSILFKTIYPTITNPSISLISNSTVTVEAGSTLFSGYNYTFNRGTANVIADTTINLVLAGTETSHQWYVTGTGGVANTNAGVSAYSNFSSADPSTLTRYEPGTYKYKVTVNYGVGDIIKTSKGTTPNPMPTSTGSTILNPYPAGSLSSAEGYQRNVTLPVFIDTNSGTYAKQTLQTWGVMTFTNVAMGDTSSVQPIRIKTPRKLQYVRSYNEVSGKYDVEKTNLFTMLQISENINGKDYSYYEYTWAGSGLGAVNMEIKTY